MYHSLIILLPLPRGYAIEIKGVPWKGDYDIPIENDKETFWKVINIISMEQINKPVLNSPIGPQPIYHLLTAY